MELKRNYKDFNKEIEEVESYLDGSFENQSIDALRCLFHACNDLVSEYNCLKREIEEAIIILDEI